MLEKSNYETILKKSQHINNVSYRKEVPTTTNNLFDKIIFQFFHEPSKRLRLTAMQITTRFDYGENGNYKEVDFNYRSAIYKKLKKTLSEYNVFISRDNVSVRVHFKNLYVKYILTISDLNCFHNVLNAIHSIQPFSKIKKELLDKIISDSTTC